MHTTDELSNIVVSMEKDLLLVNEYRDVKKKERHGISLQILDLEKQKVILNEVIREQNAKRERILIEHDMTKTQYFRRLKGLA